MSRTYAKFRCPYCGSRISTAGIARFNHMKFHERQGLLVVRAVRNPFPPYRHRNYSYDPTEEGKEQIKGIK